MRSARMAIWTTRMFYGGHTSSGGPAPASRANNNAGQETWGVQDLFIVAVVVVMQGEFENVGLIFRSWNNSKPDISCR